MFRFSTFMKDLATIRIALILSTALFALGITVGWVGSGPLQDLIVKEIQGLGEMSQELRQSENPEMSFFIFIFLNNSFKSILVLFSGIFFGIIPLVFLAVNGMVIGFLLNLVQSNGGDLGELIFKGLLPHGIIEIPMILIASAYGLVLGGLVFKSMAPGESRGSGMKRRWREFWRKSGTASLWIVLLLLVAAIIESTITLWLMS
ncbi:stage II sporulation protein M [Paenibacillus sp. N3/727]|uniref:stage II sporulation protein M n=1 Tax=Paenibacillus sp. N3/727 TaxID=2925845 RepID=UPI001F52FC47|nr:stage II sporulation protein M [Paenibacillus sp. N3/727]UNK17923.1 stage II sporulation protein M [Paenibacillus sp. N3/727]